MARYELRPKGVFDKDTQTHIFRTDLAWKEYEQWLAQGNAPDIPPPPEPMPLIVRRSEARARIRSLRAIYERNTSVTVNGFTYPCTMASALRIALMLGAFANGVSYPANGVVWATTDDQAVTLTQTQFRQLAMAMIQKLDAIATREAELAALISASNDPLAENLDTGWLT
jgi:hypothetical protein